MAAIIPLDAVPSQVLSVTLGGQATTLAVYQKSTGLYCDVSVSDATIIVGVLCLTGVRIVRDAYLGFVGDLAFVDTQGAADPDSSGIGTRWQLIYFTPADLGS